MNLIPNPKTPTFKKAVLDGLLRPLAMAASFGICYGILTVAGLTGSIQIAEFSEHAVVTEAAE